MNRKRISHEYEVALMVRMTRAERQKLHDEACVAGVSVQRHARVKLGLPDAGGNTYGGKKPEATPRSVGRESDQEPLPEMPEHRAETV
jgi:hypothetical protein